MRVRIYTDGACSGNPGPGGWAAIVSLNENMKVLKGFESSTTNNRMELMAVVNAMKAVMSGDVAINPQKDKVEIYSDSAYVVNAVNDKWTVKWKINGWKTVKGKEVKNRDLWEEYMALSLAFKEAKIYLRLIKVKGHNGDQLNEMADRCAREQADAAKMA